MRISRLAPAVLAAFLAVPAWAGVVMTFQETAQGDAAPTTGTAWVMPDKLRVETGGATVVFLADRDVIWAWQAGDKTYVELTKAQAKQMSAAMAQMQEALASMPPEQRAMMEKMMAAKMGVTPPAGAPTPAPVPLTFTATGTSQTINGWKCAEYTATRGKDVQGAYWVTDFAQFGVTPADFAAFDKLATFLREMGGPFASKVDTTYAQHYGDGGLPGAPVRVVTRTATGKSIHEIQKLSHEDIPATMFEPPAGLTKQDMGPGAAGH